MVSGVIAETLYEDCHDKVGGPVDGAGTVSLVLAALVLRPDHDPDRAHAVPHET